MGEATGIEWTDHTLNPWIGCEKVSAACRDCYAARSTFARRSRANGIELWGKDAQRHITADSTWDAARLWNRKAQRDGVRRRVFCASLADVFEDHPALVEARRRLWNLIGECVFLDWLLLTKRPQNIRGMLPSSWGERGWPHVWLGTTVEDQERANERIPALLSAPAAVRFLSCEPLLEHVNLTEVRLPSEYDLSRTVPAHINALTSSDDEHYWNDHPRIDWVIVGGESGAAARPIHPAWARALRDLCVAKGVAFHFKQWGEWKPIDQPWTQDSPKKLAANERWLNLAGGHGFHGDDVWRMRRVGKHAAGRELDGRTWDEFPRAGGAA